MINPAYCCVRKKATGALISGDSVQDTRGGPQQPREESHGQVSGEQRGVDAAHGPENSPDDETSPGEVRRVSLSEQSRGCLGSLRRSSQCRAWWFRATRSHGRTHSKGRCKATRRGPSCAASAGGCSLRTFLKQPTATRSLSDVFGCWCMGRSMT